MAKKTFKVAGVTFKNGMFKASRQEIIKKCKVGDTVNLERDYKNKHDDFAVKVLTAEGDQVGYIPKGAAKSKRVFLSLEESNVTAQIIDKYNLKDEYDERIFGLIIEVNNLMSASRADEIDKKGCVGAILIFFGLFSLLKIII